jgi:hypothetical protein
VSTGSAALREAAEALRQHERDGYLFIDGDRDRVPWEAVARWLDQRAERLDRALPSGPMTCWCGSLARRVDGVATCMTDASHDPRRPSGDPEDTREVWERITPMGDGHVAAHRMPAFGGWGIVTMSVEDLRVLLAEAGYVRIDETEGPPAEHTGAHE